jgi:hypothetical protein
MKTLLKNFGIYLKEEIANRAEVVKAAQVQVD